jgi:RNA polymerase sigma-70 factor (ECF subfamily)
MLAGDERAFDEFFDGYFPVLYRFAMARMRQDADGAEDVVQAALGKAVSKLGTFRGEASLLTWLCTFCRHEISAYYERANRDRPSAELSEEIPEVAAALESLSALDQGGPEATLRRKEIMRLVHGTLDRLPLRYADALEWKYIEGLSVREIADRLALSPKAAESLLTRAREAFRAGFSTMAWAAAGGGPGRQEPS